MENFKLNIEVGFNAETLQVLRSLADALQGHTTATAAAPAPAPAKPAKPTPQPQPEPEPAPALSVDDYDDLPPNDAPAPAPKETKPAPSEADARAAVKDARDRGVSAKAIKEYMKTVFGIAASVECPEERRAELIEGLKNLAA